MESLIDINFSFLEHVFLKNNEIFSGENSLVINEVGMLICEEIFKDTPTSKIVKILERKYPNTEKSEIVAATESFIISIWKQAIYFERTNDFKICQLELEIGDFVVLPSFIETPYLNNLSLNFHNHLLIDSLFQDSKLLQLELGYKIFYIGKFDKIGNCTGMLVVEVTRFTNSYIVNSLYGEFTSEFCKNNGESIKKCILRYFDFFGETFQSFKEMELVYISGDVKPFNPTLTPIGVLNNEIGLNSIYIYSQKI